MMTERCTNCNHDLRLARPELCDLDAVRICEGCSRVYIGDPVPTNLRYTPARSVRRKTVRREVEAMFN